MTCSPGCTRLSGTRSSIPPIPRAAAISMHRRECANDAVHGVVSQKFSLMASWHSDAKLHADFARQQQGQQPLRSPTIAHRSSRSLS